MNDSTNDRIMDDSLPRDSRPDKRLIYLAAGLVILALVAAFVGGKLLNQKTSEIAGNVGGYSMSMSMSGSDMQSFSISIEESDELPKRSPDSFGQLDHRDNNSFFIHKPSDSGMGIMITIDDEGNIQTNMDDGPIEEVVITRDTLIYKDRTMEKIDASTTQQKIKPVLELVSADEIGEGSILSVWGRKQGDRIIAEVVSFSGGVVWHGTD